METLCHRLLPGQDLYNELLEIVKSHSLQAAVILSGVGSLSKAQIRFAQGAGPGPLPEGPFEIISMTGTLGPEGIHVHLGLADQNGKAYGGHLLPGSLVHTTVELVLGKIHDTRFARRNDPATGYKELVIQPLSSNKFSET